MRTGDIVYVQTKEFTGVAELLYFFSPSAIRISDSEEDVRDLIAPKKVMAFVSLQDGNRKYYEASAVSPANDEQIKAWMDMTKRRQDGADQKT